jgi:starvation-inducible DNA-binding protein
MVESVATRKRLVAAMENGVGFRLQACLVELIDLALNAKQAHWNVAGPSFRALHAQFDEIAVLARESADVVAERLAALEVSPDGSVAAVAESPLEPFPLGWISGPKAIEAMLERVERLATTNRTRLNEISRLDAASENVLVELVAALDKAAWMLRVQQPT